MWLSTGNEGNYEDNDHFKELGMGMKALIPILIEEAKVNW
jgi:hypothetical protein